MADLSAQLKVVFKAQFDTYLNDLSAFVSIPSVSTDPTHAEDVRRAATWLRERLLQAGADTAECIETEGHPVVLGHYLVDRAAKTYIVYGHYDVQPPDPHEAWDTPPFQLTHAGDRLLGRGVSDDKAPLLLSVFAFEALRQAGQGVPVNLIFLFEGEEEIGSPSLPQVVREHLSHVSVDAVLSADGAMWRSDFPTLTTRSRGLAGLEFTVSGPRQDLHSGRHGGAVHNPVSAAAQLVASLHDASGRVNVEGFYDDVAALSERERAGWRTLPYDDTQYVASTGVPHLFGEEGYSTLERLWARPTLEINGFFGGYQGPGSKTIVPHRATVKITCRLVPNQDPRDITEKIRQHLRRQTLEGVRIDINVSEHAAKAYTIAEDHAVLTVADEVLTELYQQEVRRVGMGGSIPICETFKDELDLDTLFFSFAVADENIHAPNEFFRIERLQQGFIAWAQLLTKLGEKDAQPTRAAGSVKHR